MQMKTLLFSLTLLAIGFASCEEKRRDTVQIEGGDVTVTARVMHHSWHVAGAKVYIKANATQFPGTDSTLYDSFKISDTYGYVRFEHVPNSNYYLYSTGFDPNVAKPVWGYIPFSVSTVKGETKEIDITVPVSE